MIVEGVRPSTTEFIRPGQKASVQAKTREAASCQVYQLHVPLNADHRQPPSLDLSKADERPARVAEDGFDERSLEIWRAIEGSKAPVIAIETSERGIALARREVNGPVSKPVYADDR